MELAQGTGPLAGLRVVEIAGIGPGPHACMILADLGADIIRIDRPGGGGFAVIAQPEHDLLTRGRPSVAADLKSPVARDTVLRLVESADVLVEGLRPGAMERLGLGPDECLARNPRLVYGRMTGWGQRGPLAQTAGHDMDYIALTGALHGLGQSTDRPQFPSNLLGDFGGGSTYLVIGILAAIIERGISGVGQVIDAAIVDGTAHLNTLTSALLVSGQLVEERSANLLDGGTPYYDIYQTADGEYLAVAALEPKFFDEFVARLGIADRAPAQADLGRRDELRSMIAEQIRSRTRAQWSAVFDGSDGCVAPVLRLSEAPSHPHIAAREMFVEREGIVQPAPAPRFSRTVPTLKLSPHRPGTYTREALEAWGVDGIDDLIACGAFVQT